MQKQKESTLMNMIQELKDDVKDYIEFYNHKRFHETLDCKKTNDLKSNNKNYKISH